MAHRRRRPAVVALGACTLIALAALLISGATLGEVLLFACYELAFALLPGLALFLVLSHRPRSLTETLALAWPLGLAAEIGFFVLAAALGERWLFDLYPPLVVAGGAAVLWPRRRTVLSPLLTAVREGAGRGAAFAVVAAVLAAAAVVFVALFAPSPLPRSVASISYYPDLIFNISLAAEILHHWPFVNPSVAGVPLHYEIFANVDMAATAQITHVELSTIVMRLQPVMLLSLIGTQLFVLGRKLGGGPAAGLVAVALGLFSGEPNISWHVIAGGGASALGDLYSPSYQLGAVFFLAALLVIVDRLPREAERRWGYWLTLGVLSLGAIGAKATAVPVLAGGLGLFALGQIRVRHGFTVRTIRAQDIGALAMVVAAGAVGYLLIYRGGGQGVSFKPLAFLAYTYPDAVTISATAGHSAVDVFLACVTAAIVLAVLLLPLAGVVLARDRWWPRAGAASPERLLLLVLVASVVPFVLIGVPGDSEAYFVGYGFLAGSVVSAVGVRAAAAKLRLPAIHIIGLGVVCACAAGVVTVVLWLDRSSNALLPAYAFLVIVGVPAIQLVLWLRRRRLHAHPDATTGAAALTTLVLIALTVFSETYERIAPTLDNWVHGHYAYQAQGPTANRDLTTDLLHGLVWLREHSRPTDVIAVNNHDLTYEGGSRYFYYSAFSERRVFLESWTYTPQGYAYLAAKNPACPFPALLALNNAAVDDASWPAITTLRDDYGVRYIVIDRLHGQLSPALANDGRIVYSNPAITIYRLVGAAA